MKKVYVISYLYEMENGALGDDRFVARDMPTAKKCFENIKHNIILPLFTEKYDDEEIDECLNATDTSFKVMCYGDYAEVKIEEKEIL